MSIPASRIYCYQSYDGFRKLVASLKSLQKWEIGIENNVHYWKKDKVYETPEIEVSTNNLQNFTIRFFAWCLVNDHEIYKKYKKVVKNITLSNFLREIIIIKSVKVSTLRKNFNQHVAPKRLIY